MRFLTLIVFSMSLFSLAAYKTETVTTICFFVTSGCHKTHAKEVETAINRQPGQYISHSTSSAKSGMHTLIVYK